MCVKYEYFFVLQEEISTGARLLLKFTHSFHKTLYIYLFLCIKKAITRKCQYVIFDFYVIYAWSTSLSKKIYMTKRFNIYIYVQYYFILWILTIRFAGDFMPFLRFIQYCLSFFIFIAQMVGFRIFSYKLYINFSTIWFWFYKIIFTIWSWALSFFIRLIYIIMIWKG